MTIDSEEKAKIGAQCAIGTALLCSGFVVLGMMCFVLLFPWGVFARVGLWLVEPVMKWRSGKRENKATA